MNKWRFFKNYKVGEFSFFEGAKLTLDSTQFCGNPSQRIQRHGFRETTFNSFTNLGPKILGRIQSASGQGELDAGLMKSGWIFRCQIPIHQLLQSDCFRRFSGGNVGRTWKINGQQDGSTGRRDRIETTVLVTTSIQDQGNLKLSGKTIGPQRQNLIRGIHHQRLFQLKHGLQRFERSIPLGLRELRGSVKCLQSGPVPLRIVHGLPRQSDRAHG